MAVDRPGRQWRSGIGQGSQGCAVSVVYCLSNRGMPGLFKIGFSARSAATRARELYHGYGDTSGTGVPFEFDVVREWSFPSEFAPSVEQTLHQHLREFRVNRNREFFRFADANAAVMTIEESLRQTDWWETAAAELHEKRAAAQTRAQRETIAREASRKLEQERARISAEVREAYRDAAAKDLDGSMHAHGLKWGAIVGGVALLFGTSLGATEGYWWFVLAVAALAYYLSKDTPLLNYLATPRFAADVAAAQAVALSRVASDAVPVPAPDPGRVTEQPKAVAVSPARILDAWSHARSLQRAEKGGSAPGLMASDFNIRCPHCWGRYTGVIDGPDTVLRCSSCRCEFTFNNRAPATLKPGALNHQSAPGQR